MIDAVRIDEAARSNASSVECGSHAWQALLKSDTAPGGGHEAKNGLLLRRDVHSLFDSGYVTVPPENRFEVSRRIREEFDNGRHYYELHGRSISLPTDESARPDLAVLR